MRRASITHCHFRAFAIISLFCFLIGCKPVGHLAWSGDGKLAGYFLPDEKAADNAVPGKAFVIDSGGNVKAELGPAFGSFAWNSDSTVMYTGVPDPRPATLSGDFSRRWTGDVEDQHPADKTAEPTDGPAMALGCWNSAKDPAHLIPVAYVGHRVVAFTAVSPDGKWVAVMTNVKTEHGQLFAYCIASGQTYLVSECCGFGMCFNGPSRLVFAECTRSDQGVSPLGTVVEMTLDEAVEHPVRTKLLDVLWQETSYMQAIGDNLLLSTRPQALPALPDAARERLGLYSLSHDARLTLLADNVETLFAPSPDGKRILFVRHVHEDATRRELAVMNANGSNVRAVRELPPTEFPAMWPNWHGNDGITLLSEKPMEAGKPGAPLVVYDVIDYTVSSEGVLQIARNLSEKWPDEMKPRENDKK